MNNLPKHIVLVFAFAVLHLCHLSAQLFPYWQYTTADELASSNVNDIMQNDSGYLWFATDRGVSRFDGFKFNSYLYTEGLPYAKINSFAQTTNENVIAASPFKGVRMFGNNFHEFLPASETMANDECVANDKHFFSLKHGDYISITSKQTRLTVKVKLTAIPYSIIQAANGILVATDKGLMKVSDDGEVSADQSITEPIFSIYKLNGELYAGGVGVIYIISETGTRRVLDGLSNGPITNLLCRSNGDFWFTTGDDNNLFLLTKQKELIELSTKLQIEDAQVNKLFEDHEGNVWIATTGKGALCVHHFYTSNYSKADGLLNEYITSISMDKDRTLLIGTRDGVYSYDQKTIQRIEGTSGLNIRQIAILQNQFYIFSFNNNLGSKEFNWHGMPITFVNFSPNLLSKNDQYFKSTLEKIHQQKWLLKDLDRLYKNYLDSLSVFYTVNDVYVEKNGTTWIATQNGLICEPPGNFKTDTGFLNVNISSILADGSGTIYFGTDNGLAIFKNGKWKFQRQLEGKNVEGITSLVMDDKKRIWIGTLTGLFMWDQRSIMQFDTKNVLLSDEINALYFDKQQRNVWAGSSSGLSCIHLNEFDNTKIFAPLPMFKNLRTQDSVYRDLETNHFLELPYNARNFTLRFSAIHFSTPEGVKFSYKFDNEDWQPATGRQIEFASVPYGKHTFSIKAIGEHDEVGPVAKMTVVIQTPFWATTWFKIALGLSIAGLAYFTIKKRFETIRKKQQERLELSAKIAELRHQALAASMNPHFIFNALNSIQQFINVHDTDEASEYLGKFARLIRIMLNSGGKTFITLKEEIERLNYYLDLEKVRFGNKLTFDIQVDNQIETEKTEIPNMVIQPIVENALWHGLLPANRDGSLNITFEKMNDSIHVVVEDNGIGVNESKKRKKSGHVSLGLQMIEERLSLLKKLNGYTASIQVKDKSELSPPEQGTVVDIVLS